MHAARIIRINTAQVFLAAGLALWAALVPALAADSPFIPRLINSSTIPANGDINPYGVAFVPEHFPGGGTIGAGDVLVSNFNNGANLQGTGTTIVSLAPSGPIAPPGTAVAFFSSSLPGLSTALGVLRGGFVIVGNVPTTDGTIATIGRGALQIIDRHGALIQTWTSAMFLDGPWDLALDDHGSFAHIFVSNVLNATVSRIDVAVGPKGLTVLKKTIIATGYTHEPNAAALILGPTGLALDASTDVLYVASTADNAVFAIAHATTRGGPVTRGEVAFADSHLRGPLALRFAPNGNLLAANGDAVNADLLHPSEIVEFTTGGEFVREYNVDASQGGAFGLDTLSGAPFNYAVIDDVTNSLIVTQLQGP
jgi:DNA-binding beta-propeller fold protein YncE